MTVSILFLVLFCQAAWAEQEEEKVSDLNDGLGRFLAGPTLTDEFFDLGREASEKGLDICLSATQVYQQNVHGGQSVKDRSGRYSGSYDLEMEMDAETVFGLEGGCIFLLAEGSWPVAEGINDESVGSFFGVNDDAGGGRSIDVTELWYQQSFLEDRLRVRIGKMDLAHSFQCHCIPTSFDASAFANDEHTQFLNSVLVNNPTIPFPDYAMGVTVYAESTEKMYIAASVVDAHGDARETGFNTAFHGADEFFCIAETGLVCSLPCKHGDLPGGYRMGLWYDPQEKQRFSDNTTYRDDLGVYFGFDQFLWKASEYPEDEKGVGIFGRYGWSSQDVQPECEHFWSIGCHLCGCCIQGRDEDVLAIGYAKGRFSDDLDWPDQQESVTELYYRIQATSFLALTPSLQYIENPGLQADASDALVMALRCQLTF